MSLNLKRRYFETFDALRFLAFFLVFLSHLPLANFPVLRLFDGSGDIGVVFFFVLSGFLISYILMYEKEMTGTVRLKKFFMRRILRIWPLFYAMIFFAFLTPYLLDFVGIAYSVKGYEPNWLMSWLFLENYMMMGTGTFPNVSPLRVMWSLCIEEHFYIIWGLLLYFLPVKKLPVLIIMSVIIAYIGRVICYNLVVVDMDIFTNIDYFAYGAIPAYCLIKKETIIERVNRIPMSAKYLIAAITVAFILIFPQMTYATQLFIKPLTLGALFTALIFFTLPAANRIYIPRNHIISRLGVYTYGLYLYHTICITFLMKLCEMKNIDLSNIFNVIALGIVSLFCSIIVSMISYYLFENQFIKLKKYFT